MTNDDAPDDGDTTIASTRRADRDHPVPTMFTADPLVGLRPSYLLAAAGRAASRAVSRPTTVARTGARLATRLARVAAGRQEAVVERGDRRFTHDAWDQHPLYRRLGQAYLTTREEVYKLVDDVELDERSRQRAEFALGIAVEALAPTNSLFNPEVVDRARETNGRSLVAGARNFYHDVRDNGGMPSMVDSEPFSVGDNVAATPGRVVHRDAVLELIQYEPTTTKVRKRPVLFIPPQINKYYVLDIGPGKSMVEYLVGQGQQVFVVSWRNPTVSQRDWDLDHYVAAVIDAVDAACEVTGSDDLNIAGACAGGITVAALLGHLAAVGSARVRNATFLVTVLDTEGDSAASAFVSETTIAAAIRRSQKKGLLKGEELARIFAWLRPNDLVCNYWVNNWLKGNAPPAFDILAWNADTTNLPAGLHADFLGLSQTNPFVNANTLEVLDVPIDLSAFTGDTYVVAGLTDHITPWESCFETTHLVGGKAQFILSSSGHIQALVNPPGRSKSRFVTRDDIVDDPDTWLDGAQEHQGTWWAHWAEWLDKRGGRLVNAPAQVGSDTHPPGDLAPGRYVHNL